MIDWSHPIYRSVQGYLGYEWGTFSDNCHKPPGLWPLSTTTHTIQHGLMEKYGALYRGSGTVTHRLSLYRTQPSNVVSLSATLGGGVDKSLSPHNDNGAGPHQDKGLNPPRHVSSSALVFGAGTVQWSFALSSFHDGGYITTGGWVNGGGSRTINYHYHYPPLVCPSLCYDTLYTIIFSNIPHIHDTPFNSTAYTLPTLFFYLLSCFFLPFSLSFSLSSPLLFFKLVHRCEHSTSHDEPLGRHAMLPSLNRHTHSSRRCCFIGQGQGQEQGQ